MPFRVTTSPSCRDLTLERLGAITNFSPFWRGVKAEIISPDKRRAYDFAETRPSRVAGNGTVGLGIHLLDERFALGVVHFDVGPYHRPVFTDGLNPRADSPGDYRLPAARCSAVG